MWSHCNGASGSTSHIQCRRGGYFSLWQLSLSWVGHTHRSRASSVCCRAPLQLEHVTAGSQVTLHRLMPTHADERRTARKGATTTGSLVGRRVTRPPCNFASQRATTTNANCFRPVTTVGPCEASAPPCGPPTRRRRLFPVDDFAVDSRRYSSPWRTTRCSGNT